jgi:hypothetical protein
MVAENIPCNGGGERFFHRSLYWAFNTVENPRFYAVIESRILPPLKGTESIDLLVYENTKENNKIAWKQGIGAFEGPRLGKAYVELKTSYNRKSVNKDVNRLRKLSSIAEQYGSKELYVILMVGHYYVEKTVAYCLIEMERGEQQCWDILVSVGVTLRSWR